MVLVDDMMHTNILLITVRKLKNVKKIMGENIPKEIERFDCGY